MDEEMGEGGMGLCGAWRGWTDMAPCVGVERRGGAGCRRLGAGPEQSNRVDGKILETHGVKF